MPHKVARRPTNLAFSSALAGGGHAAAATKAAVGFGVGWGAEGAVGVFLGAGLFGLGGALVLPLAVSVPTLLLTSLERGHR
jgi:hypothetical protein